MSGKAFSVWCSCGSWHTPKWLAKVSFLPNLYCLLEAACPCGLVRGNVRQLARNNPSRAPYLLSLSLLIVPRNASPSLPSQSYLLDLFTLSVSSPSPSSSKSFLPLPSRSQLHAWESHIPAPNSKAHLTGTVRLGEEKRTTTGWLLSC